MKTANVNGKIESIAYKTNTGMYTRLSHERGKTTQYGADVYTVDGDDDNIVLVAKSSNGSTLKSFTKVISAKSYEFISDLYDPYNAADYHFAGSHLN